jgi:hypothetical protein
VEYFYNRFVLPALSVSTLYTTLSLISTCIDYLCILFLRSELLQASLDKVSMTTATTASETPQL